MAGDRWRFVDGISGSTRLDLNDETNFAVQDRETSPPPLRRQTVESFLTDGDKIPASAFDNRVVRLKLELLNATEDGAATQRQALARELARSCNFLEYRPVGATSSVWFKTYRSESETFARLISARAYQTFDLPITCEPFAYGAKETLPNVTFAANPLSANGLEFTVTAAQAKGDVEAPLNLKFADASKMSQGTTIGVDWLIGTRRRGTVASMPYIFQAEAGVAGTDTALGVNSALYSGAGNNNMLTTFVTTTMQDRVTLTVPGAATKEARGQYRVLVKLRPTAVYTGLVSWSLHHPTNVNANFVNPVEGPVTLVASGAPTNAIVVDLGILSLPGTPDPTFDGPSGTELAVATGNLALRASRTSGTGNLAWDFIALVPADDNLAYVKWVEVLTLNTENCYIDGYTRRAWVGTDTEVRNYPFIQLPTSYPMITPNQDNRICMVPDFTQLGLYPLTTTHTITPSYWPRYIDVRPAAT